MKSTICESAVKETPCTSAPVNPSHSQNYLSACTRTGRVMILRLRGYAGKHVCVLCVWSSAQVWGVECSSLHKEAQVISEPSKSPHPPGFIGAFVLCLHISESRIGHLSCEILYQTRGSQDATQTVRHWKFARLREFLKLDWFCNQDWYTVLMACLPLADSFKKLARQTQNSAGTIRDQNWLVRWHNLAFT